jgi:small subunit ribosomal protein S7
MRRKQATKIELIPDPRYGSIVVAKFVNNLMERGKKSIAQDIFYSALEISAKELKKDLPAGRQGNPLEIFEQAIKNTSPLLEVKSRRVGGANYQVPYEVKGKRKEVLSMRWIIGAARKGKGKEMAKKLAKEFIDAYNNTGEAVKKKEDTHKVAEANRAFAHFAW